MGSDDVETLGKNSVDGAVEEIIRRGRFLPWTALPSLLVRFAVTWFRTAGALGRYRRERSRLSRPRLRARGRPETGGFSETPDRKTGG